MSAAKFTSVQQEICRLIKRFRFEELESSVMPAFPEISWTNIRSELVKHRKNFTPTNAAEFITLAIAEIGFQQKVLKDRLSMLQLIDISWHNSRKIWYAHALVGSNRSINYVINRKIEDDIQDYFHSLNITVNVKVCTHNGITYISLVKEQKKGRKRKVHPIPEFIALFVGQKYIFCSKKNVSQNFLSSVIRSIGYDSSKRLKLMGRDLRSLIKLCWKKMEGALDPENITKTLVYRDATPELKDTGIDFTQHKQRRKYAEKCFGDDPPTLELLVIQGPSQPLVHKDVSIKLPTESMHTTWEFRSQNIATSLTKLIERRILVTPVPCYISNLMMLGKNELTLRSD